MGSIFILADDWAGPEANPVAGFRIDYEVCRLSGPSEARAAKAGHRCKLIRR